MQLVQTNLLTNSVAERQWIYVARRFLSAEINLRWNPDTIDDAGTKLRGVISSINRTYRNQNVVDYYILAGSWGKGTAIHPPTDIDVLCFLPPEVFHKFNGRQNNGQSQLLQDVRRSLAITYPQTRMRGDGQVVVIDFNSIRIEVVPAFHAQGGGVVTCDSSYGGKWKSIDPNAEIDGLSRADVGRSGNVRKITKLAKQWQRHCNVPIKSFHIEQLVQEAICKMTWGANNEFWFDWIVRDVFLHMYQRAGGGFLMPGPYAEWISFGDAWQSRAWMAYERACKASDYERANMNLSAGTEWQ